MSAKALISTKNVDDETFQSIIMNIESHCDVRMDVDKSKNRISVTGDRAEVNKAEEYAENEGAEVIPESAWAANSPVAQREVGMIKMDDHIEIGDPPLEIYVEVKDLTTVDTDVIVNPRASSLTGGQVTAALEKAEPEIGKACQEIMKGRNGKVLDDGEIVHTTAGDLPCRQVIHVASEPKSGGEQMEYLSNLIGNILNHADYKLEATSIAIPGLGAGGAGHPAKAVAEAITEGVKCYARDPNRAFMRKIYLVDTNSVIVQEWKKGFDLV